ncbi:Sodium:dicarboxylate symporter family protein [Apodospora peruviana]|uniref:Amino acid transporter n=1 Tax=Apodospora peruviana TaxID=516989 RepID=A0AAE0HYU8_9PEZI|nr:Sodium:dicarboxylate symporter family protein [Apodospora peruviana]
MGLMSLMADCPSQWAAAGDGDRSILGARFRGVGSQSRRPNTVITMEKSATPVAEKNISDDQIRQQTTVSSGENASQHDVHVRRKFHVAVWENVKEEGSALQIVIAAALAIAIGLAVTSTVDDIPVATAPLLGIPGTLWLRCLKAVVLPLIVCSIIMAVQRLKDMTGGKAAVLARWTIGYYVGTTVVAIVHSIIMTSLVWRTLMTEASKESLTLTSDQEETYEDRSNLAIHTVVVQMFESFIPSNVVNALATDSLLAVLVSACVVGYLIDGRNSSLLRAVVEVEKIILVIITWLIKKAPIGVFFLILPNMFKLDLGDIGRNLGILIGGSLSGMGIHLFIVLPIIFFAFTRKNPYAYWLKCSPAWTTAWGTASSAATLPVSLKVARARGVPNTIVKFAVPLGCLINMDGTAIYFPVVVVFMAATQGITLGATDYVIIVLLSTLASIGTTPIPSSSLVLTVMIAQSVNVPLTGMYAVVVAIDWFIDRFRTATNVSGDLFAAAIMKKVTGITDDDEADMEEAEVGDVQRRISTDQRV